MSSHVLTFAGSVPTLEGKCAMPTPTSERPKTVHAPLEAAAKFALLAPSPRNMQPWRIAISDDQKLVLWIDRSRSRPVADPMAREAAISCGVALGYIELSLQAQGVGYTVTTPVDPDQSTRIATIRLTDAAVDPDSQAGGLVEAAARRHTNWSAFIPRPLSDNQSVQLRAAAYGVTLTIVPGDKRAAMNSLIDQAHREQQRLPGFAFELQLWPSGRPVATSQYSNVSAPADAAGSLVVLSTESDLMHDWITTGKSLAKVLLVATQLELAATFMNQPLQLEDTREQVTELLELNGAPQQLLRLGTPVHQGGSPTRRSLDEVTATNAEPW